MKGMDFDNLTEDEKKILRPFFNRGERPSFLNPKIVDRLIDRGLITAHYNEFGFVQIINMNNESLCYLSENPHILD